MKTGEQSDLSNQGDPHLEVVGSERGAEFGDSAGFIFIFGCYDYMSAFMTAPSL